MARGRRNHGSCVSPVLRNNGRSGNMSGTAGGLAARGLGGGVESGEVRMTISVEQLRGGLIPAVPVPFGRGGEVHETGLESYVAWMAGQPIAGVAVWAHTGRGLRLSDPVGDRVLGAWRRALPPGCCLIAAAGARPGPLEVPEVFASARSMARRAASLGADALLVYPPVAFRDRDDRDPLILDYHAELAEVGLPLVLFYLYEAAGGISYPPDLLASLLGRPEVLGIKVATLDSVMTFQDIARLIRERASGRLLISGEDRFLGYSLICGAQAALIGMAAACTHWQAELLQSFQQGDAERFLELSAAIDDLAQHTFLAPMEGYIQRMLWCLVHQGIITEDAAHDPWGPALDPSGLESIGTSLARLERLR
jgi:4-hydroxy-tetrahydrodipicolinate synthase